MGELTIVAIIGAIGTVVAALISIRQRKDGNDVAPVSTEAENESTPHSLPAPHVKASELRPVEIRRTDLTHRQIADAIQAVPPFHQDKIHDDFIDIYVSWPGRLRSIYRSGDEMTITSKIPDGQGVLFCYALAKDCEDFILAPEGTPFVVTGQIKRVSRYEARLENCRFRKPEGTANATPAL